MKVCAVLVASLACVNGWTQDLDSRWVELNKIDGGAMYADVQTLGRPHGTSRLFWQMTNYAAPRTGEGVRYQSQKTLFLFDCTAGSMATKAAYRFSGPHGSGKVVREVELHNDQLKFDPVMPSSGWEQLFDLACSSK